MTVTPDQFEAIPSFLADYAGCLASSHDYRPLGEPYWHVRPGLQAGMCGSDADLYDQTVAYRQLYCRKCGGTLEIVERGI